MIAKENNNKLAYLILVVFGIIFSSVSFVNHYNFRTYALDLGLYNNALFDYARFEEMDKKNSALSASPEWECLYKENFAEYSGEIKMHCLLSKTACY